MIKFINTYFLKYFLVKSNLGLLNKIMIRIKWIVLGQSTRNINYSLNIKINSIHLFDNLFLEKCIFNHYIFILFMTSKRHYYIFKIFL
jgi:hypothetical protein